MYTQVYAAFMAHTDYEIGRVIKRIKDLGQVGGRVVSLERERDHTIGDSTYQRPLDCLPARAREN